MLILYTYNHSAHFPAERYASAGIRHEPVSACVSVTRRYCVKTAERIQLIFVTQASFGYSTLCCKEIQVSAKLRALPVLSFTTPGEMDDGRRVVNRSIDRPSSPVDQTQHPAVYSAVGDWS